jgi:asparagine synthetase B (glutamine-hydrolysing)
MKINCGSQFEHFAVFGLAKNPKFLEHKLSGRLGIAPRTIDFGTAGRFFFHSSYGDIVETEEALVLKLGFIRSPTMSPLSAKQLIAQKAISPGAIDHRAFRGNALVASFSKREPSFLAFRTILSGHQLYYSATDDGTLCATSLRVLISMLDRIEMNQDAVVPQFLFGAVLGPATHFRNIYRLFPGELLRCKEGELAVDLAQDLRFADDDVPFDRADSRTLDTLYERFKGVITAYIDEIEESGSSFGNLLSGGVDSSFLQLAINEARPGSRARSFSYAVRVPSVKCEIEYAKQAVSIFNTAHTFTDITEGGFPSLLVKATNILAQPVLTSAEVCKFGHAECLSKIPDVPRFFFVAGGADTLFGVDTAAKVKTLEYLKRIPASEIALMLAGTLLKPLIWRGQTLLNLADILTHWDDPDHFTAPINTEDAIPDFTLARRAFGDEAVRRALQDRRDRVARYLDSNDYTEKVHVVVLFGDTHEIEAQSSQLFLAYKMERLYPFLDEDIIRSSFAFRSRVRYVKGLRYKYILKEILEERTTSPITRQPKGGSMFHADLHRWMRSGSLRDMVRDISLPGSLSRADFERLVQNPDLSLWHLLAFDVFQKQVLQMNMKHEG